MAFGAFSNFFFYQAFFTGIYNYRNSEILNMRQVPLIVKVGLSTAVTFSMCRLLWKDHLYNEDYYRIAIKYRGKYDEIDQNTTTDKM